MEQLKVISLIFTALSLSCICLFFSTPFINGIVSLFRGKGSPYTGTGIRYPQVSLVVAVHNGESLVAQKIENSLSIDYPPDDYEVIIFSDGSTDGTLTEANSFKDARLRVLSHYPQEGKNLALNKAVAQSTGDIVVFTDVDAILGADAVKKLLKRFLDPLVGGVCGRRVIGEAGRQLSSAQNVYIKFDNFIKNSGTESVSNDGKLYAIRKQLYTPLPPNVADDLYVWLSVVRTGYRFLFAPEAVASIRIPSRNAAHELVRRRRIVSTSLRAIFLMKTLLNPFKYGTFSLTLFLNKILRRVLPFALIALLFSSLNLSLYYWSARTGFFLQFAFYLFALLYPTVLNRTRKLKTLNLLASVAFYFCIGNWGTLLGVVDFITGKEKAIWTPVKTD